MNNTNHKKIHIVLQSKGGVGKSVIATMLAQYFISKDVKVLCIDVDPMNDSFHQYSKLNVRYIQLMEKSGDDYVINPRKFDSLIELIDSSKYDAILDSGASSFIEFTNYLATNDVESVFEEINVTPVIHCVIAGGDSFADTLKCFTGLARQFTKNTQFVLWLNQYFASMDIEKIENSEIIKSLGNRLLGIIKPPIFKEETFGVDFQIALKNKQLLDELINSKDTPIMVKSRLKKIKNQWNEAIESVL